MLTVFSHHVVTSSTKCLPLLPCLSVALCSCSKSDRVSDCLQADLALASAQNTSRSHSGLQPSSLAQFLEAGNFSVSDAFQALTNRSKGAAASARSASGLPAGQLMSALERQSVGGADEVGNALPSSSEDSRSSAYSSQSGSSCSNGSSPRASNDSRPDAQAELARAAESRPEVRLTLDHSGCHQTWQRV